MGAEFALTGPLIRIGRGDNNDIVLTDSNCSRNHAELVFQQGYYAVKDLGSRNGVYVNGRRVGNAVLAEGDTIQVGGTGFQFYVFGVGAQYSARGSGGGPARSPSKMRPILLIVGGAAMAVIALALVIGSGKGPPKSQAGPGAGGRDVVDLDKFLDPSNGRGSAQVGRDASTTAKKDAKKKNGKKKTKQDAKAEARAIFEEAQRAQESGRLVDARDGFKRALELDNRCQSCRARLTRLTKEIRQEIEYAMRTGKDYMEIGRYDEAVASFERILLLEPDVESPYHENAKRYIATAKKKNKQQRF